MLTCGKRFWQRPSSVSRHRTERPSSQQSRPSRLPSVPDGTGGLGPGTPPSLVR